MVAVDIETQLLSPSVSTIAMSMIYFGGFLSGISTLEIWNMGNPLMWGSSLLGKAVMPFQKLKYPATVVFNLQIDIDSSIRVLFNVLLFSSTVLQLCEADCWVWSLGVALGVALCFEFSRMSEHFLCLPLVEIDESLFTTLFPNNGYLVDMIYLGPDYMGDLTHL